MPVGQRLHSPARMGAFYLECQVQGLVLQVQDPVSAPSFRSCYCTDEQENNSTGPLV